jgi:glutathione S-transferase
MPGMSLTLHYHPLSSFSQKVVIALYELGTPFETKLLNLGDVAEMAAFKKLWPIGKMPVLEDAAKGRTVAETSIIIEYLDRRYPGPAPLLPADPEKALQTRFLDRFYDLYLQVPMQKIVGDRLRPKDKRDPLGVEQARAQLKVALDMVEADMAARTWAIGDDFTMADCAAAPALYYTDRVMPFVDTHPHAAAYFGRLRQRPSYTRVFRESEPYLNLFPQ